MLTHNFKNAIVNNLAINWQNGYDVSKNLYFVDMKGVQRRMHRTDTHYQSDLRYLSLHSLFFGSVGVDEIHNRATKDYDNLDDMIASNSFFCYGGRQYSTTETTNSGAGILILGSGDTPPTPDDYCLDSWIPTADLSVESYAGVGPHNEYPPTKICSLTTTFRNNTNENITVKEVGVCIALSKASNVSTSIPPKYILLVRDVLQNPVIIKPDEITSFTVVMK